MNSTLSNKTTPRVMITGDRDHTVVGQEFHAGVNFFLFKPADRSRPSLLASRARALEALSRRDEASAKRCRHLLEREHPDVKFNRKKIREPPPVGKMATPMERYFVSQSSPCFSLSSAPVIAAEPPKVRIILSAKPFAAATKSYVRPFG